MDIRVLTLDDLPDASYIASQSFMRGAPVNIEPERFADPKRYRIGVFEKGRLRAQYSMIDYRLFFGGELLPCGGIAGVAVDPAARGRGYAGALIKRSLEIMREKGQFLSILWPFDHRYYRGYGWESSAWQREYKVPVRLLKADAETENIDSVRGDYEARFNPIYEAKARRYNGPVSRDTKSWDGLMRQNSGRDPAAYIYERDGQAEGYAIFRYANDEKEGYANELVTLTPRAYRAFLGLMSRHAMTVEWFKWSAPMDDSLWSIISHWDVETKLEPAGMGRIVDVQAALSARKPPADAGGLAVVEILDQHASWNQGTWKITLEGGATHVQKTDDEPGVRMDIQALSQAYWGTPSLAQLWEWERLEVRDENQLAVLQALLPERPVWLYDDF